MKNRTKIRLCSYGAAVLAVAAGLAVTGWRAASHWRTRLENHYQQAWAELSEYLAEMESTLNKLLYTNSLPEQTVLSAELLRDAGGAQHALSVLPSDAEPMADVYRYLAQAGEYAQSLAARRAAGEAPDEASAASLAALYDYAASLNDALLDYRRQTTPVFTHESLALEAAAPPSVTDGFRSAADELEAYPTLLYDGAFADRVEQAQPRMTASQSDYGAEVARQSAVDFQRLGGLDTVDWTMSGEIGGNLPCRTFTGGDCTMAITRDGAFPAWFRNARAVGDSRIDPAQAVENARVFLAAEGFAELQPCWYDTSGGRCTVLFAAAQDGVLCYPDQIKLTVALDTGAVVGFDATPYWMNHTERTLPTPAISEADARARLSSRLIPPADAAPLVVIPTAGGSEAVCYEFACTGVRGERVLVYLDAADGRERSILIAVSSAQGTFVR